MYQSVLNYTTKKRSYNYELYINYKIKNFK